MALVSIQPLWTIILNLRENQNAEFQGLLQYGGGSQDVQLKTFSALLIHLLALYVEKYRLINASLGGLFSYVYVLLLKLTCRAVLPIKFEIM